MLEEAEPTFEPRTLIGAKLYVLGLTFAGLEFEGFSVFGYRVSGSRATRLQPLLGLQKSFATRMLPAT